MTINYIGTLKADILFEDDMTYHGLNDNFRPLQAYINKATYLMETYGFSQAQIVDCETGEIIVEMEIDYKSCNNPSWDDDGDTCDYE